MTAFRDRLDHFVFNAIYSRTLVYNGAAKIPPCIAKCSASLATTACSSPPESAATYSITRCSDPNAFWDEHCRWFIGKRVSFYFQGLSGLVACGIAGSIRDCVEHVFRQLPISTNSFWRLYLTGRDYHDCCLEYLTEEGHFVQPRRVPAMARADHHRRSAHRRQAPNTPSSRGGCKDWPC